jgi:chemotaxis protein CheD
MVDAPKLIVGIGDIKIGKEPSLIRTNLGSCIGVCLYHAPLKVGGLLHCMLPFCGEYKSKPDFRPAKFADSGLQELVAGLKKTYGVESRHLTAKIFGGASMLKDISMKIGQDNEHSVRTSLRELQIPVVAFKTGGEKGYQIDFNLSNGAVSCRIFGHETEEF